MEDYVCVGFAVSAVINTEGVVAKVICIRS